jgi:hypothetical protein
MTPLGTAFIIPVGEREGILGQVMAKRLQSHSLLAAFSGIHELSSLQRPEYFLPMLQQKPIILASSFDILIKNGTWEDLGVFPIPHQNQFLPKYKSARWNPFLTTVETYDGTRLYSTLPFLAWQIPRRLVVSAKLFETLALSANGRGTWDKKYDRVLFERMPVYQGQCAPQPVISPVSGHIVSAKIMDSVLPMERGSKYGKPLDQALQSHGYGQVTGAGTQMSANKSVTWVTLDLELANLKDALEFTRLHLRELGAPAGSLLEYRVGNNQITLPINENST